MSLRNFSAAAAVAVLAFAAAPSAMASATAPTARLASPSGTKARDPWIIRGPFGWARPMAGGNFWICESPNDHAQVFFQNDGNLVDYDETGRARWSSQTAGRGDFLQLYGAGGLAVLDNAQPIWSNNLGHADDGSAYLTCQDDGNVVIYNNNNVALWSTRTVH